MVITYPPNRIIDIDEDLYGVMKEMDYPCERLTDLSNSEASKLLKNLYTRLETVSADEELEDIKTELGLNENLFEDLIELMILKGWLEYNKTE